MVHNSSVVFKIRSSFGGALLLDPQEPILQKLSNYASFDDHRFLDNFLQDGQVLEEDQQYGTLDPSWRHWVRAHLCLQESVP